MKNKLLALSFLLIIPLAEIQAQDHLTPAYSSFGWKSRQDMLINEILFDGKNTPIASFMIAGRSVLVLDFNRNKDTATKYVLTHRQTTDNSISRAYKEEISSPDAWKKLDHNKLKVTVQEFNVAISDDLALAIRSLFLTALSQTRLPHRQGLDGISYTFTSGLDIGRIWYPKNGTKMYELAKIGKALIEYTISAAQSDSAAKQRLIDQMKALEKLLKANK